MASVPAAIRAIIVSTAATYQIPPALLAGVIQLESGFDPNAIGDPQLKTDRSLGLMQIRPSTAGAAGFRGTTAQLMDPATNVKYGAIYLRDCVKAAAAHGYGLDSALSSYNGGQSSDRPGDGKRTTSRVDGRTIAGGPLAPFINQAYVDRVLGNYKALTPLFAPAAVTASTPAASSPAGSASTTKRNVAIAILTAVAIGLTAAVASRHYR